MTVGALVLGLALGFWARHKMSRTPPAASTLTDPRRQLGAACVALRASGHKVQERSFGSKTFIVVEKKTKG